jgi:hypothetical protein
LVIVGVLGFVIYGTLTEPNPQLISWVRVALWLGLLVYFFYQPTLSQRRITQKIWQSIQAQPRMEGTVTPAGVTFTFGEDIQDLPWERFFRIRKSEDMTILLAKNGILSMFPRRFFPNSAEWSQVHQLIDQHVKAS